MSKGRMRGASVRETEPHQDGPVGTGRHGDRREAIQRSGIFIMAWIATALMRLATTAKGEVRVTAGSL